MEKLGMVWVRDTQYEKLDGSRTYEAKYYRRNLAQPAEICLVCDRIKRTRYCSARSTRRS